MAAVDRALELIDTATRGRRCASGMNITKGRAAYFQTATEPFVSDSPVELVVRQAERGATPVI